MQYHVQEYEKLMQEIKERLIFTAALCKKLYLEQRAITKMDIEICCLQIRKMLELIAMGSLIVNKGEFEKISKRFETMWNAKYILREIKRINPAYLPQPIKDTLEGENEDTIQHIEENILTEELIEKILEKCGGILHTPNPFGSDVDYRYYYEEIQVWVEYIFNTVRTHIIIFPEGKGAFIIQFNAPDAPITSMVLLRQEE